MELMKSLNPHQLTYRYLNPSFPPLSSYNFNNFKTHQKNSIFFVPPISVSHPNPTPQPTPLTLRRLPRKPATYSPTSDILRLMDGLDLPVPLDVYTILIKECTATRDPVGALELCRHVIRTRLHPGRVFVNRVLLMLVSCGLMEEARQVFDKIRARDSNSWAIIICGYIDINDYEEAIQLFLQMDYRKKLDDDDTCKLPFSCILVCVLKACVETKNLEFGKQIHGLVIKFGYEGKNLFLSSSLMNFYGNFGFLEGSDCVFSRLETRNTAIWTNKLVNFCKEMQFKEAIEVFIEMGRKGVKKNEFTFSSVLRACSKIEDNGLCGRQVHCNIIKLGFELNDFVHCGLVNMYAECGLIECSERVFRTIRGERTLACWNAMLKGYIRHGYCVDAIKILYAMKLVGLQPRESLINEVKFTCGRRVFEGDMEPCVI